MGVQKSRIEGGEDRGAEKEAVNPKSEQSSGPTSKNRMHVKVNRCAMEVFIISRGMIR